jgi:hypothetical protein
MTITLTLSEEKKAQLQRQAAAAGTDVERFILDALDEKLAEQNESFRELPFEEWSREFRKWAASHRATNAPLDDSRESIYD